MQTIMLQFFKMPYFYIFLGIFLIILLCILFHKRIKSILRNIDIHIKKTNTLTLDCKNAKNEINNTAIEIDNIEIKNSKTGNIEGKVSINNVKIKDSTIGSVRGR